MHENGGSRPVRQTNVSQPQIDDKGLVLHFAGTDWPAIVELLTASGQAWPAVAIEADLQWWIDRMKAGERCPGRPLLRIRYGCTDGEARTLAARLRDAARSSRDPVAAPASARPASILPTQRSNQDPAEGPNSQPFTQRRSSQDPVTTPASCRDVKEGDGPGSSQDPARIQFPRARATALCSLSLSRDLSEERERAAQQALAHLLSRYTSRQAMQRLVGAGVKPPTPWAGSEDAATWLRVYVLEASEFDDVDIPGALGAWDAYLTRLLAGGIAENRRGAAFPRRWREALLYQLRAYRDRGPTKRGDDDAEQDGGPGRATSTGLAAPAGLAIRTVRG